MKVLFATTNPAKIKKYAEKIIKGMIYRKIRVLCDAFCGTPPEKARFHF